MKYWGIFVRSYGSTKWKRISRGYFTWNGVYSEYLKRERKSLFPKGEIQFQKYTDHMTYYLLVADIISFILLKGF